MSKEELEKAIENSESVWVSNKYCYPYEVKLTKNHYIDMTDNKESLMLAYLDDVEFIDYLEYIFKTEKQALHYHNHANITRTETLPFLTWEEFDEQKFIWFVDKKQNQCCFYYLNASNKIFLNVSGKVIELGDLTEENFYKAYDECVKFFVGVEDE